MARFKTVTVLGYILTTLTKDTEQQPVTALSERAGKPATLL